MPKNEFQRRITRLMVFFLVALTGLVIRLFDVQAVNAGDYKSLTENELYRVSNLLAPRGEITDIKGIPFARSVSAINVVVDQQMIVNPEKTAEIAAPILKMSTKDVLSRIVGDKRWYLVARNATPAQWNALKDAFANYNDNLSRAEYGKRIVGFFPERNYTREYPAGSIVASLIGFVNQAGDGAAGIESGMNSILKGQDGRYVYANGIYAEIPGSQQEMVQPKPGNSIRLTIDRDIQFIAENAIAKAVRNSNAASGTVIVMDPKTGAILAHATAPTFDPNKPVKLSDVHNASVQDVYEPGSTGKVMTLAAAIEEKLVTPTTVFSVPYKLKTKYKTFKDHDYHPVQQLTTAGILAVSSNTGTIKIGDKLSDQKLYDYLRAFGVGSSTNSGLPGESAGLINQPKDWSGTTKPTMSFGQGYSVTAMQATSIFATIANDGVRVEPTVIAGTSDAQGHYTPAKTRNSSRVISAETAQKMRAMMESVVSASGTAPSAAIPGYRIAGKTGTAERVDPRTGRYSGYTASFIGMAPADKPKYVINVTIQAPQGMHWGGVLGGPVFKEVMSYVLEAKHIPPTNSKVNPVPLNAAELAKLEKAANAKKQANKQ
ncbi:MAG: peptidoglycan D,D-transpeptidase FtsI family protein [Candidatus Nanopelagicaceae bacterium]|jgi:cell division protein FtsI (penicillin-binding protein 3)